MRCAIVILNWNTRSYLNAFLPGILSSTRGLARVYVADNASTDGSLELLREKYPEVTLIPFETNLGFTGGYNRALEGLDAEYYLLLNSDIEVAPGWLEPLLSWMDSHPSCAACGPKLHALVSQGDGYTRLDRFEYAGAAGGYLDRYGYPWCRGRVLNRTEPDSGQYDTPARVLWATGACLMVRSGVWRQLGGLDPRFFAHQEEIDFCWRAARAGYEVWVVPESTVWHLGGGTLPQNSPFKLRLNYRNNLLMLWKNLPRGLYGWWTIAVRYTLDLGSALVYALTGRFKYASAVFAAHREFAALRGPRPSDGSLVAGYTNVRILPQSFVRGGKIFRYLFKYEDSN